MKLVSEGLSHIGTALAHCYFDTSLIAIHNYSSVEYKMKVGSTFSSLMLYKKPKLTRSRHDNPPYRSDLIDINSTSFSKTIIENSNGNGDN